jgi:hypothetical protein
MTMREFLESRRKAEYPAFMKVMKAMPTVRLPPPPGACLDAGPRNASMLCAYR